MFLSNLFITNGTIPKRKTKLEEMEWQINHT